jgi:hypothetical protein
MQKEILQNIENSATKFVRNVLLDSKTSDDCAVTISNYPIFSTDDFFGYSNIYIIPDDIQKVVINDAEIITEYNAWW